MTDQFTFKNNPKVVMKFNISKLQRVIRHHIILLNTKYQILKRVRDIYTQIEIFQKMNKDSKQQSNNSNLDSEFVDLEYQALIEEYAKEKGLVSTLKKEKKNLKTDLRQVRNDINLFNAKKYRITEKIRNKRFVLAKMNTMSPRGKKSMYKSITGTK